MSTPELVRSLLEAGFPVRAAEVLLSSPLPRARSLVHSLARGGMDSAAARDPAPFAKR